MLTQTTALPSASGQVVKCESSRPVDPRHWVSWQRAWQSSESTWPCSLQWCTEEAFVSKTYICNFRLGGSCLIGEQATCLSSSVLKIYEYITFNATYMLQLWTEFKALCAQIKLFVAIFKKWQLNRKRKPLPLKFKSRWGNWAYQNLFTLNLVCPKSLASDL